MNINGFRIRVLILALAAVLISGCTPREENITFTAQVESVGEDTLLVTTQDDVGFDRASVSLGDITLDFTPEAGQTLRITILPQIRESYPVQVTAVSVELAADADPA